MRVSRAGLLVAIALSVPLVVELRTVLAYFGLDLSVAGTVAVGVATIAALVLWAVSPELTGSEAPNGS